MILKKVSVIKDELKIKGKGYFDFFFLFLFDKLLKDYTRSHRLITMIQREGRFINWD